MKLFKQILVVVATILLFAACDRGGKEPIVVNGVTLNKTTLLLEVGDSETLTATVEPDNVEDKTVAWTSSDPAVATVSNEGVVTAVAAGATTITASAGDKSATCALTVTLTLTQEITEKGVVMQLIPAGSFQMGSPDYDEEAKSREKPQHWVRLTQDFYVGKYPVTNAQYVAFLNEKNIGSEGEGSVTYMHSGSMVTETQVFVSEYRQSLKHDGNKWVVQEGFDNFPVVNVTWFGAVEFATWVGGVLPTEAQWEYACRAGTTTIYNYGDVADGDYMWYKSNSGSKSKEVGTRPANQWGLYDMHGNVLEWCLDQWAGQDNYPTAETAVDAVENPLAIEGDKRIMRGGGFYSFAQYCRSAYRISGLPEDLGSGIGFRVVYIP